MSYTKSATWTQKRARRSTSWYLSTAAPQSGSAELATTSITVGRSRTGDKVHNFRGRIRQHLNAAGGMSASEKRYYPGFGIHRTDFYDTRFQNGQYVDVPQFQATVGDLVYVSMPDFPSPPSADVDKAAQQRLLASAVRAFNEFRTPTFVGELRDTLRMIRSPAKALRERVAQRIAHVTKHAPRIKSRRARKRWIRETYLEWVFGINPLRADIESAGNAFNRRLERYQGSYTRVAGKASEKTSTESLFLTSFSDGSILKRGWDQQTVSRYLKSYYGEVRSYCANPVEADMRLFGASWMDLVLAGWECVPWSFVVDYFVSVGSFLEAWTVRDTDWAWLASVSVSRSTNYVVNLRDRSSPWTWPGYVSSKGYRLSLNCTLPHATHKAVWRSTPLSAPTPSLQFRIPGVGSQKWLNLAALTTAIGKQRRVSSR